MNGIDTTTVKLVINGVQAEKELDKMQKSLVDARKRLDELKNSDGDPKAIKKLNREIDTLEKNIARSQSQTKALERSLSNLDKMTPHELNRALKDMNASLKRLHRGTDAWDAHVRAIKEVKTRLAEVKNELQINQSYIARFKQWATDTWPSVYLIKQGYEALTGVMFDLVDAYAVMDQEMANVRKFTGLSAKEVEALNDRFKEMDTRTSREQLNQLAQEAGRLGKTSTDDILGFVRAADKINVALDDIGDGATLTLSKLTGVFGIESVYGTEQSLLKVGSVVNELSQNCAASAPYLTQFAERMGGVGAQAKLTIQQIMGFGAVLDSNAQKVEASATAVSQVLVRMLQAPAKYARVAGLDVKKFSDLLRKDANSALLLFLDTLQKAGGMDVLSPMFSDMGENGSRAITALSTLATHIDDVKKQQQAANEAFEQGVSVDKEFNVQNNTVQANLEKYRKRAQELRVELGERLAPIMSHVLTVSKAFITALSTVVSFILEHKGAIITLTAAIAAYNVAVNIAVAKTKLFALASKTAAVSLATLKAPMSILQSGFYLLTGNISKATTAWKSFSAAVKLSPLGLLASAITAVSIGLVSLFSKAKSTAQQIRDLAAAAGQVDRETLKELDSLERLTGTMKGAKAGTEEYEKAKKQILNQWGKYLTGLVDEKTKVLDLDAAYNRLTKSIKRAGAERNLDHIRETVEQKFFDSMADNLDDLEQRLITWGASAKDAAFVRADVAASLSAGTDISARSRQLINYYSNLDYRNFDSTFERTSDAITKFVNTIPVLELFIKDDDYKTPASVFNEMVSNTTSYREALKGIDQKRTTLSEFSHISDDRLDSIMSTLEDIKSGKSATPVYLNMVDPATGSKNWREVNASNVDEILKLLREELAYRGAADMSVADDNTRTTTPVLVTEKERKAREAAERRAAIKARKDFKDEMDVAKGEWLKEDAVNSAMYAVGLKKYSDYLQKKHALEIEYFDSRAEVYKKYNLTDDDEYQGLLRKRVEAEKKWQDRLAAMKVDEAKKQQKKEELDARTDYATPGTALYRNEEALQIKLFDIKHKYLKKMQAAYAKNTDEWQQYQEKIDMADEDERLRRQQTYLKKVEEMRKKFGQLDYKQQLDAELEILQKALYMKLICEEEYLKLKAALEKEYKESTTPESARPTDSKSRKSTLDEQMQKDLDIEKRRYETGLISAEEYAKNKQRIERYYRDKSLEEAKSVGNEYSKLVADFYSTWDKVFNSDGDIFTNLGSAMQATCAVVSAAFSMTTQYMQAALDAQVAQLEKRYDREIELVQGNTYRVAKLEKKKEQEIAKLKSDASKKMYAMQVIQAVAQTATNALNAYGSAAAIPVVGHILAPIAAAMAVAAGMVQVATIKKQQQAADSQGYRTGGFTPDGRPDEVAGVVHKGEWVASQKLLSNPATRPLIDALDYMQRNNTIGSLRSDDVSRSLTAANSLTRIVDGDNGMAIMAAAGLSMQQAADRLANRLNEPIVAISTITGEFGSKRAWENYDRLIANKSK